MKDRWMDAHRQVGSIPTYSTNGSYICTKLCVIQVLVRKRKTNYGDSYYKELEETDRILLARRPKNIGYAIVAASVNYTC